MTRLNVRVVPNASRDQIDGFGVDGVLRARVTAPPVDRAANAALVKLLSRSLKIPARDIVLVSGDYARRKGFEVELSMEEMVARLGRGVER